MHSRNFQQIPSFPPVHRLPTKREMTLPLSSTASAAFTLTELLISLTLFSVVGAIIYTVFIGDLSLYVRNLSINKSTNSLRTSLQQLKHDIEAAIEPPQLVNYDPTKGASAITAVASGVTSAQGIRIQVNTGPAYNLPVDADLGKNALCYFPANATSFVLERHVPSGNNGVDPAPAPRAEGNINHNDRLMFLYPPQSVINPANPPASYTQQRIVEGGVTTYNRAEGSFPRPSAANDKSTKRFTVELENVAGQPLPPILENNSALIIHEVAYVAYTVTDANGNPVSRELRYFPSADDPSDYKVVSVDLDPNPQERDAKGKIVQPFNYQTGSSSLFVNLPIRAVDYAQSIAERYAAAGKIDNASEFNVFISSKPTMANKIKLD